MDGKMDLNIDPSLRGAKEEAEGGAEERAEADEEWEYEYSNTETEDFYVIIDMPPSRSGKDEERLPVKQPSMFVEARDLRTAQKKRKQARQHQVRRRRRRNPETGELEPLPAIPAASGAEAEDDDNSTVHDAMTPETINEDADEDVQADENGSQELSATSRDTTVLGNEEQDGSLRLWNLSSDNPLLHYRGRLFQLHWANGLGTDMYFVKREENEQPATDVLQSFGNWDLLGCSGARLVASEAHFRYKGQGTSEPQQRQSDSATSTNSSAKPESSSFLRRLVELQVKKGEIAREDVIFPEECDGRIATTGSNSRMAFDMLMGQVDENEDGRPVIVSDRGRGGGRGRGRGGGKTRSRG